MSKDRNKVLLVIPAYNEADNLERVINHIRNDFPQYDYVVINDGSTDATRKVCADNRYNVLDLPVNIGLTGAIKAGFRYANYYGYDYVVQIDGDGQHDPLYVADLLERMEKTDCDIVIGSRFVEKKKPKTARMIGNSLIELIIWCTTKGTKINDTTSGMRLFNKKMIKQFGYNIHYSPEPDTLAYLINQGAKIEEVQVEIKERIAGTSYLSFTSSAWYMMRTLFSILIFQWFR